MWKCLKPAQSVCSACGLVRHACNQSTPRHPSQKDLHRASVVALKLSGPYQDYCRRRLYFAVQEGRPRIRRHSYGFEPN